MPVTCVAASSHTDSGTTPHTASITVDAACELLVVVVTYPAAPSSITALNIGVNSMELLDSYGQHRMFVYQNPTPGTRTLSTTPSGTATTYFSVIQFSGVNATTPHETLITGSTGTTSSPSTGSRTCPDGGMLLASIQTAFVSSDSVSVTNGTHRTRASGLPGGKYYGAATRDSTGAISWSLPNSNGPHEWAVLPINAADTGDVDPPVITGPGGATGSTSSISVAENQTTVHTFTADESVTWDLNGGADVAKFQINSSTGALTFIDAPDYESPTDADTNNTYVVGVRATDAATNATTQTVTVTVTNVDDTAPTLTSPGATATGQTTASLAVTTDDGTGTLYAVVTGSATAPTVIQVQTGLDHNGDAAAYSNSGVAVSGTGEKTGSATGLTANTTYYAHYQHKDAAGNDSTVVTSASFTTDEEAVPTITTDPLRNAAGTLLASTSIAKVVALKLSDMTVAATWTDQTTDVDGVLTLEHASLTAVPHLVVTSSTDGSATGAKLYTPA